MKSIKRFAISLLFLISLFILNGFLFPKITYETRVEVSRPADKSFFTFIDAGKMGEWLAGFEKLEYMSGMPGTPGSTLRLTFERNGKKIVAIQEIIDFSWNKLFEFTLENKMMKVNSRTEFIEKSINTEIVSTNVVQGRGVLWRFLMPYMKSGLKKQSQENFDRLKLVIESI